MNNQIFRFIKWIKRLWLSTKQKGQIMTVHKNEICKLAEVLEKDKELEDAIHELELSIRWLFHMYVTRNSKNRWCSKEDWANHIIPFNKYETRGLCLLSSGYFGRLIIDCVLFLLDRYDLRGFFRKRKGAIRETVMFLLKKL